MERCVICGKENETHDPTKEKIDGDDQFCYKNVCKICGKQEMKKHHFSRAGRGIGKAILVCSSCGAKKIEPHEHDFWCHQCDYCGEYDSSVVKNGDFYIFEADYDVTLVGYGGCEFSKIIIPEGITDIRMGHLGSFDEKDAIVEVEFPTTLKSTGLHIFYYCKNLVKVTMNEGLEKINQGAFGGCSSLSEIYIPATVNQIDSGAFSGCKGLTFICRKGSAAHSFAEKGGFLVKLLPEV